MKRIVCFGDSITAGASMPEGRRWTTLLDKELNHKWEIFNRGVGSNATWHGLARFDTDIKPLLPAVVLIEFGFNDAAVHPDRKLPLCGLITFEEHLAEISRLITAGRGKPVLIANHPIRNSKFRQEGNKRSFTENYAPYQRAIRKVAAATRTPLLDLEKSMKKARVSLDELLGEDGLHLSVSGHAIYARHIFTGLKVILGIPKSLSVT